ncbi:MAG: cell division protein SepF [Ruminococcus sp.]|nr:cell division protein SepF [Ruminococcus sp.]
MSVLQGIKSLFVGTDELEQESEYQSIYDNKNDYEDTYSESRRETRIASSSTLQIVLARPNDFSEVKSIGGEINEQKTVLLNLETVKSDDAKRILDFISGVAYANGAEIKMMAQKTFAIMPRNVSFSGIDLMSELENNGYSF